MKKMSVLPVVLLALFIVLPAGAQVKLGVIGGLNLASASVDPEPTGFNVNNRTAFGIGGVVDIGLGETFALRLEPMFLQKGPKIEVEGLSGEIEFKASYFEVPAMFKLAFGSGDTKPYVIAGPSIGFLLSAKQDVPGVGEEDVKDEFKSVDFGLVFGAGVAIPMGNNSVFVEARYALGLSDVNDGLAGPDPNSSIKTKGIQIFAGITFPISGGEKLTSRGH